MSCEIRSGGGVCVSPGVVEGEEGEEEERDDGKASVVNSAKRAEVNNNVGGGGGGCAAETESEDPGEAAPSATQSPPQPSIAAPTGDAEWLCVSRLPRDCSREEVERLLADFGEISHLHLVRSKFTGKFTGLALASFASKASSLQARHVLQGKDFRDGHSLDCQWVKPAEERDDVDDGDAGEPWSRLPTAATCLFVDRLPPQYRDMAEFRRAFSAVAKPPYCQIAMKHGVIQRWGLVEFATPREAEDTLDATDGIVLGAAAAEDGEGQQQGIRVQFCTPGVRAINIYMDFVNNPMDGIHREKKALLEEAPSSKVYDQLKSLAQHNPWFVQNLQRIMASSSLLPGQDETQHPPRPTQSPPASSAPPPSTDPAQAALILLLASRAAANTASPAQTAALLRAVLQKMESGASAAEVLAEVTEKGDAAAAATPSRPVLLDTPGQQRQSPPSGKTDLRDIIAGLVKSSQEILSSTPSLPRAEGGGGGGGDGLAHRTDPHKKDPTLTEMLLKSFQARVRKGVYAPNQSENGRGGGGRMGGQRAFDERRHRHSPGATSAATNIAGKSRVEVFKYPGSVPAASASPVLIPPMPVPPPNRAPPPPPSSAVIPAAAPGVDLFQAAAAAAAAQAEQQQQQQLALMAAAASTNPYLPLLSSPQAAAIGSPLCLPTSTLPLVTPTSIPMHWPGGGQQLQQQQQQQQYYLQQQQQQQPPAISYTGCAFALPDETLAAMAAQMPGAVTAAANFGGGGDAMGLGKRKGDSWDDLHQAKRMKFGSAMLQTPPGFLSAAAAPATAVPAAGPAMHHPAFAATET